MKKKNHHGRRNRNFRNLSCGQDVFAKEYEGHVMFVVSYSPPCLKHQAERRPLLKAGEGRSPSGAVRPHNQIICISQIIKESAVCVARVYSVYTLHVGTI